MAQYLALACSLIAQFAKFEVAQVLRLKNRIVDTLPNLASNSPYSCHVELNVLAHSSISEEVIIVAKTRIDDSWMTLLVAYLKDVLLEDKKVVVKTKARATKYTIKNDTLYRRSFLGPYQRCVPPEEVEHIIKKIHKGICGTHIDERSLCHRIMMQGFYWLTMK